MVIEKLILKNFRNFPEVNVKLKKGFNFFQGCNGAGKTSLLEAVYYLIYGRSFRTGRFRNMIKSETLGFEIFVEATDEQENCYRVGLSKQKNGDQAIRISGQLVDSRVLVAKYLPIQLLAADDRNLIDDGPEYRRRYLDWGLFYQQANFLNLWQQSQKILRHRNALLRAHCKKNELIPWNQLMVEKSSQVNHCRQEYLMEVSTILNHLIKNFGIHHELSIRFYPGWSVDKGLEACFEQSNKTELKQGCTMFGYHRADIKIQYNNMPAKEGLSRGFRKLFNILFRVAQVKLLSQQSGKSSVFLVDDLSAELDDDNRSKIYSILADMNSQILATGLQFDHACSRGYSSKQIQLFHVKHDSVRLAG